MSLQEKYDQLVAARAAKDEELDETIKSFETLSIVGGRKLTECLAQNDIFFQRIGARWGYSESEFQASVIAGDLFIFILVVGIRYKVFRTAVERRGILDISREIDVEFCDTLDEVEKYIVSRYAKYEGL